MIRGIYYGCETCFDFGIRNKCNLSREVIHDPAHSFIPVGPEYTTESEASDSESDSPEEDEEEEEQEEEEEEEKEE